MKRLLSASAALVLAACAAAAAPGASTPQVGEAVQIAESIADLDVHCGVRLTPIRRGLRAEAVFSTTRDFSGDYEFVVTKRDAAGSSDILQGGEFDAAPGAAELLGVVELELERDVRLHARLVVSGADGALCSDEVSS